MVPSSLRKWFVIHFIADMMAGLPLLLFPKQFLAVLGLFVDDTFAYRVVGAALMGIGWESLLGRNAGPDQFRGMLRLKLIWASSAIVGMSLSILVDSAPAIGWWFVGIFGVFFCVWAHYAWRLR